MISFYHSPLGHLCRQGMTTRLLNHWQNLQGYSLAGIGYCSPFLEGLAKQGVVSANIMPARMGVAHWPPESPNQATITEEDSLPLREESIERLLVCHVLEHTEDPASTLQEFWRVLAPEGRVMFLVPNRRSLWSRADKTPFGHGRPYSRSQMRRLLEDNYFEPLSWTGLFYGPPGTGKTGVRFSRLIDPWGRRLWPGIPGAWLVEARKRVIGLTGTTQAVKKRSYVFSGASSPIPS